MQDVHALSMEHLAGLDVAIEELNHAFSSFSLPRRVTAIRRLIEKLGPTHSGMFFHYDGTEYPW